MNILLIGLGGFLGAISRHACSSFIKSQPYKVMLVNLLGCFFLGFLSTKIIDLRLRMLVFIGFLGSFTTFSTFISDNYNLMNSKDLALMGFNIFIQIFLGLIVFHFGNQLSNH